jgi:hypothetical protein
VTLTEVYRARLAVAQADLVARVRMLAAQRYDPQAALTSLNLIAQVVANWTAGAQRQFADEARAYLTALIAQAHRIPHAEVAPVTVPDVAGTTAAGIPMLDLARVAPAIWAARTSAGLDEGQAALAAARWLERIAASEPYRAAAVATLHAAIADDRFTGRITRVTRAAACPFCLAARGSAHARAGFAAHAHCGCTASPTVRRR